MTPPPSDLHVEWRSPELALALDLSLVEHVFRTLAKQRHNEHSETVKRRGRDQRRSSAHSSLLVHKTQQQQQQQQQQQSQADNQCPSSDDDSVNDGCKDDKQLTPPSFDADMRFTKSDVLVTLERADGFLKKRPLLRRLHTSLACVSSANEGASTAGFVRYRVQERTLSFAIVRAKLLQLHDAAQQAVALVEQTDAFKAQARTTSLWCVRDWKSRCRSPAQLYSVHVLPVKPKTQLQLDRERRVLEAVAAGVVSNALALSIDKIVGAFVAQSRPSSTRRSARNRLPDAAAADSDHVPRKQSTRSDPLLRTRVRRTQASAEAEAQRIELRLQIFAPGVDRSALLPETQPARNAVISSSDTSASNDGSTSGEVRDEGEGDELEYRVRAKTDQARLRQRQLLLLATVEANGVPHVAARIAAHNVVRSGLKRALEHAANLGLACDDDWGRVKIWRTVYRSHTLQALQSTFGVTSS